MNILSVNTNLLSTQANSQTLQCTSIFDLKIERLFEITALVRLSSCQNNCSIVIADYQSVKYNTCMMMSKRMFVIRLEKKSNKIQHRRKVNDIKIFLVEYVSSKTQLLPIRQKKFIISIYFHN